MTKKLNKKLSFEKAIKMASLPVLSDHEILSAKKRVWNSLDSEISLYDKKLDERDKSSNYKLQTSKIEKPWFLRFRTYSYSLAFASICLIIATGSFTLYSNYLQTTPTADPKVTERLDDETAKNVQALAASRFSQLNGVTFEEFKAAIIEEKPQNTSTSINEPTPTNIVKIDTSKGENIITALANKDIPTFITDKNLEIADKDLFVKSDIYLDTYKNLDTNKFTITTSTRPNYFKQVIKNGDNIIYTINQNPTSNTIFKGGIYAIKQTFTDNQIQIAGISNDGNMYFNPDTKVLQEILTNPDSDLTKIPSGDFVTTIKNKDQNTKFVYTLDKDTLSIKKQEFYIGEKLVYTLTTLNNKEIKAGQNSIDTDFSSSELENKKVEIKEIKSDLDFTKANFVQSSFKDFSTKQSIFSFSSDNNILSTYQLYDYSSKENSELLAYQRLTQTADFDPNFSLINSVKDVIGDEHLTLQKTKNIEVKIYSKTISFDNNSAENISITFKGEKLQARLLTQDPNRILSFTDKDFFYILTERNLGDKDYKFILTKDIKLETLTLEKATSIDKYIADKSAAKPILKEVKLEDLSKENSDFAKKFAQNKKLEITNIYTFAKTSTQSTCEKYYLDAINGDYLNCLLEENNGFIFNTKSQNSSTFTVYYFTKDGVEKKYLDVLEKNKFKVEKSEGFLVINKV